MFLDDTCGRFGLSGLAASRGLGGFRSPSCSSTRELDGETTKRSCLEIWRGVFISTDSMIIRFPVLRGGVVLVQYMMLEQ